MFPSLPSSSSSLFLPCLLFFLLYSPSLAAYDPFINYFCGVTNYTANSRYESNLNRLFSSLVANTSLSGGSTDVSIGQGHDEVYGLVLCGGDIKASLCLSCIKSARDNIVRLCPYKIGAVIWFDTCLLHYSHFRFSAATDGSQKIFLWNAKNMTDRPLFDKLVSKLLSAIADWAAYNSSRRFATGEVYFTTDFPTVYGLAQCSSDLSPIPCRQCFQEIIDPIPEQLQGKQGAMVINARCYFRYEVYKFYEGLSTLKLGSPPPPPPLLVPPFVNPAREKGEGRKITPC